MAESARREPGDLLCLVRALSLYRSLRFAHQGMMANPKALETDEPSGLRTVTVRELAMALGLMVSLTFSCVELT